MAKKEELKKFIFVAKDDDKLSTKELELLSKMQGVAHIQEIRLDNMNALINAVYTTPGFQNILVIRNDFTPMALSIMYKMGWHAGYGSMGDLEPIPIYLLTDDEIILIDTNIDDEDKDDEDDRDDDW